MVTFIVSLVTLLLGYMFYGRFVERVFAPDRRQTPSAVLRDDVDYIPMKTWKATMIQLLNIAGPGPIFGALLGACFGPVVCLWIVLGCILGGAVHDYMSGMISERSRGGTIVAVAGEYLGPFGQYAMRLVAIPLLLLAGALFISMPAMLLAKVIPTISVKFWVWEIVIYYLLATLLPIDKIIGWLYPVFGVALALMALFVGGALLLSPSFTLPELSLANMHPKGTPIWPFMFVTVACGAVSGFHSTQSPLMAKCMISERDGRKIFYGAMILEGLIALIWATAGHAFYGGTAGLTAALDKGGPASVVFEICKTLFGTSGAALAILGVAICPITSGDTSYRILRLTLAEWLGIDQRKWLNRLLIAVPLLCVGALLTQKDFVSLWRYIGWLNQVLAMVALWVATAYLMRHEKYRYSSIITALPATFMTAVTVTYLFMAPELGLKLPVNVSYPIGIMAALVLFMFYIAKAHKVENTGPVPPLVPLPQRRPMAAPGITQIPVAAR